jgi:hypothetical protein
MTLVADPRVELRTSSQPFRAWFTGLVRIRPILYPFVIGIYPVVHRYAKNASEIPLDELALPITIVLTATLLIWGLLTLVLRNAHRAGLVTTLALVLFATVQLSTGAVETVIEFLSQFWVRWHYQIPTRPVEALQLALFAFLAYRAMFRLENPRGWTPALNTFAILLILLPTTHIVQLRAKLPARPEGVFPPLAALPRTQHRPDIYYIILDGFARGDVLKELFDYDLEPFLKRLERRGFFVARRSTSNYCQTPLSLASSLNGNYLQAAADRNVEQLSPSQAVFHENAVVASLRPLGYRFVNFSSGFDFTDDPRTDIFLSPYRHVSGFHRLLLESTPLCRWLPNPLERDSYLMTRERTLFLCDKLPQVARIPGPTFTFAHILSPHPPFVFGAQGEDVSPHGVPYFLSDGNLFRSYYGQNETAFVSGYRRQIAFLTQRIERAIDGILANSPEPPIIVLQSDHGSGLGLDLGRIERTDHWERMSILNAYYLPGDRRDGLTDYITPVNSFRMIFNNQFGAHLALLPDRSYYSPWMYPLSFVDVTREARRSRARPASDVSALGTEPTRADAPAQAR